MTGDNAFESFGQRVRRLRREKSWSQEQLAGAAALSLRTVQRVERGAPCAFETVQSFAAALDVDVESFTRLLDCTQANAGLTRWLKPGPSAWIGAALAAPAILFILANVLYYELGVAALDFIGRGGALVSVLGNPLIVLGGPLIALAINLPHLIGIRIRTVEGGAVVEGVAIAWRWPQLAVMSLAGAVLAVLFAYLALEELGHMMQSLVSTG